MFEVDHRKWQVNHDGILIPRAVDCVSVFRYGYRDHHGDQGSLNRDLVNRQVEQYGFTPVVTAQNMSNCYMSSAVYARLQLRLNQARRLRPELPTHPTVRVIKIHGDGRVSHRTQGATTSHTEHDVDIRELKGLTEGELLVVDFVQPFKDIWPERLMSKFDLRRLPRRLFETVMPHDKGVSRSKVRHDTKEFITQSQIAKILFFGWQKEAAFSIDLQQPRILMLADALGLKPSHFCIAEGAFRFRPLFDPNSLEKWTKTEERATRYEELMGKVTARASGLNHKKYTANYVMDRLHFHQSQGLVA